MSVINSYQAGTNFTDSITSGVFGQIGNATTGVPTGVPLVYAWLPTASQAILTTPDTNPNFATSKGAYINFNNSKLASPFVVVDQEVPLDCCRILKITANQAFTVFASVKDFYGEPMTFGGAATEVDEVFEFVAPRGASAINSIKVSGSAGLTNIQVYTTDALELPYSNINKAPVSFVNYNAKPLYGIYGEASTPYLLQPLFDLINSVAGSEQTLSTGNVRPIFSFKTVEGIDIPPFDGDKYLMIGQNVNGFGFNIPLTAQKIAQQEAIDTPITPFLNVKNFVLGDPSFKEGWKGWQG